MLFPSANRREREGLSVDTEPVPSRVNERHTTDHSRTVSGQNCSPVGEFNRPHRTLGGGRNRSERRRDQASRGRTRGLPSITIKLTPLPFIKSRYPFVFAMDVIHYNCLQVFLWS
jgi:hypothetical protein